MEDKVSLKGWFKIDHFDKEGNLIETMETPNAVMNLGFKEVACLMGTDITAGHTAFDYIAVGTGTTTATATDTILETEVTEKGLTRAAGAGTNITDTVAYDTFQLVKSFSPTSGYAVTESGVLNASSTGILLCRQTFSAINVSDGDTLTVTWKVKVS